MDALIPFTTSGSLVDLVDSKSISPVHVHDHVPVRNIHRRRQILSVSLVGSVDNMLILNDLCSLAVVEKVMVLLRDGRKLIGVFRSYDQFGEFLLLVLFHESVSRGLLKDTTCMTDQ